MEEHILQFAISIDDEAIRKAVMARAEKEIVKTITQNIEAHLFENRYGRNIGLNERSEKIVEDWLNDHKSEIIDKAAEHLADKLSRTKAAKEMLTAVFANGGRT